MNAARTSCLFCQMIAGHTAAVVVVDEPATLVILDHRPVFKGHCLVFPKFHAETLSDVPLPDVGPLFEAVQRVARAVEAGLAADGTFVAMNNRVSQSVPHLHVHVVPRHKKDGLRGFFWPRQRYDNDEEATAIAEAIRRAL